MPNVCPYSTSGKQALPPICWSQSQGAEQTSIEIDPSDALRCMPMYHARYVHPVLTEQPLQCPGSAHLGAGKVDQANGDGTVSFSGRV